MDQDIGIRVPGKTKPVGNLNTTQHQLPPLTKGMHIKSLPYTYIHQLISSDRLFIPPREGRRMHLAFVSKRENHAR
jgi:hypothetical protein